MKENIVILFQKMVYDVLNISMHIIDIVQIVEMYCVTLEVTKVHRATMNAIVRSILDLDFLVKFYNHYLKLF